MVSTENKSEENAIKTGYIAENIDIYSLFWQKLLILYAYYYNTWCVTHPKVTN